MSLHLHAPWPLLGSSLSSRLGQFSQRSLLSTQAVQRGTIVLSNAISATATITAVDLTRAICTMHGASQPGASTDLRQTAAAVVLTNATTVTATQNLANAANATTVNYEVLERVVGFLRSLQRGTIATAGGVATTATITAVVPAKSSLADGGFTTNNATMQANLSYGRTDLTNATTVTFNQPGAFGIYLVPYTVAEEY